MNSFKMAFNLLKTNLKTYSFYMMVVIVSSATYYNFAEIQNKPEFAKLTHQYMYAETASYLCSMVLIITVIFFIWHANNFFFKERQKEIGLYMLMGITSSKIGKIFAIESAFLGGLSLAIGLPIGMIFSKLFFMLLEKAMMLNTSIPFSVSIDAIMQVIIVFFIIFLVLSIRNYIKVKRSQLIDMINSRKKGEKEPKLKYFTGILGLTLIIGSYILGLNAIDTGKDLLMTANNILIAVCIGTYFLFGSFLTIIFKIFVDNKNILYKNVNIVSISTTYFRLGTNYRSLAMTAILAAATVTAFSSSLSFKKYADANLYNEVPYSISYLGDYSDVDDEVLNLIEKSEHKVLDINKSEFCLTSVKYSDFHGEKEIETIITSYGEVKDALSAINYKNKDKILKEIEPQKNEAVFSRKSATMGSTVSNKGGKVEILNNEYSIKDDP